MRRTDRVYILQLPASTTHQCGRSSILITESCAVHNFINMPRSFLVKKKAPSMVMPKIMGGHLEERLSTGLMDCPMTAATVSAFSHRLPCIQPSIFSPGKFGLFVFP